MQEEFGARCQTDGWVDGSSEPGTSRALGRRYLLFQVDGMRSLECAHKVEGALVVVPGVVCAKVNLAAGTARVLGSALLIELEAAIAHAGYLPIPPKRISGLATDQILTELEAPNPNRGYGRTPVRTK